MYKSRFFSKKCEVRFNCPTRPQPHSNIARMRINCFCLVHEEMTPGASFRTQGRVQLMGVKSGGALSVEGCRRLSFVLPRPSYLAGSWWANSQRGETRQESATSTCSHSLQSRVFPLDSAPNYLMKSILCYFSYYAFAYC